MFLRPNHRAKDGKEHTYWSLVETVRTPDGPRQRTLCYLGELNGSAQSRWLRTVEVFNEAGESHQLKLFPSDVETPPDDPCVARVLVNKVRLERTRQFGSCYLGLHLWKQLGLDRFFEERLDADRAEVPWSRMAAVLAINRLCAPGSELGIEERWYPSTAMEDLLAIPEGKLNDTRLYRCLDKLLPEKTRMEQHLKRKYGELFEAEFEVLLYDLTSTYVEGAAEANPMLRRGYSRDHRPDCEQLVIALIVNIEGFPFSYEVFNGNRADVSTMEAILRTVERKYGAARRVWVMDRGIVSEANLAAIRRRDGQYLVGTPRSKLKEFERELTEGGWERVRPEVEVKLVSTPAGQETYVLCRTSGRKEKEKAIRNRFSIRIEKALASLEKQVRQGRLKNRDKIHIRLGRIQASHPQAADLYEMKIEERDGKLALDWAMKPDHQKWRETREGAYLLRTNLTGGTAEELWTNVYPTHRSRSFLPCAEKRAVDPAPLPSTRTPGEGACDGRVSRLCAVGDAETRAQEEAIRSVTGQSAGSSFYPSQCRHRSAYSRGPRTSLAANHRTLGRTEIPPSATWLGAPRPLTDPAKM
jgi:hypothetical protein